MDYLLNSFLDILHLVKDWMPNLFNIFTHSEVAIGITLAMILIGIGIFLYLFVAIYIPTKSKLDFLTAEVRKTKDSIDMVKNLSHINKAMRSVSFVRHSWRELRKNFIFPDKINGGPIRTSRPVNEFFNMETAEEGGVNIKQYSHIADNFVGIGLVFTFLGLVSGIYFAAQGLAGDVEEAKLGLVQLLDAATFKFMTSIAGVGIATLFTIGYHKIYHNLEIAFVELSTLLEARILTATIETIAFAQHNELKKQTKLLEDFVNSVNDRLVKLENK